MIQLAHRHQFEEHQAPINVPHALPHQHWASHAMCPAVALPECVGRKGVYLPTMLTHLGS